jgi:hypothetical protein
MEVTSHDTPAELKERLEETLGPQECKQSIVTAINDLNSDRLPVMRLHYRVGDHRVVFAGTSLEDGRELGESGVQNNATLRLCKPSAWSAHLKRYNYSTLQYWDKSTVQAQPHIKTKPATPSARPKSPADTSEKATNDNEEEGETAVDKLAVAAAAAHKKSLARILQRKVHAEFNNRHVSARAAFAAFVSRGDNLATVDDLNRGFVELGVRMPLGENAKRPVLKNVITDVLRDFKTVVVGGGMLAIDGETFQLWIAPEPSELASVYTEKILAKVPEVQGENQPVVSKAVERAQRTVEAIESQLKDMNRQINEAEVEHTRVLEVEAVHSEKRAVSHFRDFLSRSQQTWACCAAALRRMQLAACAAVHGNQ